MADGGGWRNTLQRPQGFLNCSLIRIPVRFHSSPFPARVLNVVFRRLISRQTEVQRKKTDHSPVATYAALALTSLIAGYVAGTLPQKLASPVRRGLDSPSEAHKEDSDEFSPGDSLASNECKMVRFQNKTLLRFVV